jgi:hypothetical protein
MEPPVDTSDGYVPGACNIGAADVRARARIGWAGVVATIVLAAVLLALRVPPWAMLLTMPTAYVAATGLLQARARFCVGYAAAGRYGFGEQRGPTGRIVDAAARAADRARARQLNGRAARWTIAVVAPLVAAAWLLS